MSDPTDPGGVGAAQAERVSRTTTRVGDTGSPVGSPLTIILSVIAVVAGFLIFRSIDSGGSAAELPGPDVAAETTTTVAGTGVTVPPTTPPAPVDVRTGAQVIVINAARQPGAAGEIDTLLKANGYSTDSPVTNGAQEQQPTTIVYYAEGTAGDIAKQVADTLARDLGGVQVQPGTADQFTLDGDDAIQSATVFLWLGVDKATITTLAPATPAAPAVATTTTAPA